MPAINQQIKQTTLKIEQVIKTYLSPAWLSVILIGLITSWVLFVLPANGVANNGDFNKWFEAAGLYPLQGFTEDGSGYFTRQYGILQYYNPDSSTWLSSQSAFLAVALFLNKLFYSHVIFDMRFLGGLYLLYYLGAIYLLTSSITGKGRQRSDYLLALLVVFILGDTSYTLYFHSFYVLALVLITTVYLFALSIAFYRRLYPTKFMLSLFLVNAFLLITLHQQFLYMVLFLLAWLVLISFTSRLFSTKMFALFGTFTILLGASITFSFINLGNRNYQHFQAFSQGLMKSTTQDIDLEHQQLNSQYALVAGEDYFAEYLPIDVDGNEIFTDFYQPLDQFWLLTYYLEHPVHLVSLMKTAMPQVSQVQDPNLGNLEKSQGEPAGTKSHFFNGYQTLRSAYFPKTFGFYLVFSFIILILYVPLIVKSWRQHNRWRMLPAIFILSFLMMTYLNYLTAIINYGIVGITLRLFIIPLIFDLILIFTLAELLHRNLWRPVDPLMNERGGVSHEK
ncbi:hypothetical protein I6N95_00505 [Vagococcus sp. BWB3-3]|uniref:Uncharacterized protein n=1 Tax=Vagococcus allomyrinae TaxID=2794353 RepID=A0A940P7H6_9ENTE|nr:hypothetical protein [Vagococcus allomyrinae]MBP1039475.1 hypothetical protein [Vagococcus allomyrinae]